MTEKIERLTAEVGMKWPISWTVLNSNCTSPQLAPRYLLSMQPSVIARHLRLERQLREQPTACL